MRQRRETPEPWASAMERAGIRSLNDLAKKSGVAVQTVARLVHAEGEASDDTIERVAAVLLRNDARQVPKWAGRAWTEKPRTLPEAAGRLSAKQWSSVVAVINAMAYPGFAAAESGRGSLRAVEAHQDDNEIEAWAAQDERRRPMEKPGQSTDPYLDT